MNASEPTLPLVSEPETAEPRPATGVGDSPSTTTIPVIEEFLEVDRKAIDKGGYRITKRVSSHHETLDELLREEQVLIERRQIGTTLSGGDIPVQRYEGDVLVIPVIKEILVTEKRLVLIEEVRITRIHGSQRRPQQVTLRTEEVFIERLAADDPSASEPS